MAYNKTTLKELKRLIESGDALDVTNATNRNAIPEPYTVEAVSENEITRTGLLLKGESGQLYAVAGRTSALFIFA